MEQRRLRRAIINCISGYGFDFPVTKSHIRDFVGGWFSHDGLNPTETEIKKQLDRLVKNGTLILIEKKGYVIA